MGVSRYDHTGRVRRTYRHQPPPPFALPPFSPRPARALPGDIRDWRGDELVDYLANGVGPRYDEAHAEYQRRREA